MLVDSFWLNNKSRLYTTCAIPLAVRMTIALLTIVLAGCNTVQIKQSDRDQICKVSVVDKTQSPNYQPHPLGNPVTGPLFGVTGGAGAGAITGLEISSVFPPSAIVLVPAGAIIGGVAGGFAGLACGVASIQYSKAPTDLQDILARIDKDFFRQSIQNSLLATKPICVQGLVTESSGLGADTILEINKISVGMACGSGKQQITVTVDWRAISSTSGRLIGQKTSECKKTFSKAFDEWFADKRQAQNDVEGVFARMAEQVTIELYFSDKGVPCRGF